MKKILIITVSIAVLAIFFSFKINTAEKALCIIVNSANPVASMTDSEAKLYYLRKVKKRWPEINKNIQPVDRASAGIERDVFYEKILKMNADNVEKYFSEKEYQNAEPNRKKVQNEAEMIQFVADNVGAIGFASKDAANGNSKVKIVLTIQ